MVYLTGDLHGEIDIGKLNTKRFPQQYELTKDDYVIVLGDFGLIWDGSNRDNYWLDWLNEKTFTTLFLDGNHENFDLLNRFPVTEWHGGNVHKIRPSIFHLMRGEVFNIDEKSFFAMGGARSHDVIYRKPYISWWPEEIPSDDEQQHALNNLKKHNWEVDFIITHCAPSTALQKMYPHYRNDRVTAFLELIRTSTEYSKWFFGHYHDPQWVDDAHCCLYNNFIEVTDG